MEALYHDSFHFGNYLILILMVAALKKGPIPSGTVESTPQAWFTSATAPGASGTRAGNQQDQWYINRFASRRHAIIVTLDGPSRNLLMVCEEGNVIDQYPEAP